MSSPLLSSLDLSVDVIRELSPSSRRSSGLVLFATHRSDLRERLFSGLIQSWMSHVPALPSFSLRTFGLPPKVLGLLTSSQDVVLHEPASQGGVSSFVSSALARRHTRALAFGEMNQSTADAALLSSMVGNVVYMPVDASTVPEAVLVFLSMFPQKERPARCVDLEYNILTVITHDGQQYEVIRQAYDGK